MCSRTQGSPNRTRTVLVVLSVVLSAALVVPAVSGTTIDVNAQEGTDEGPDDGERSPYDNATAVESFAGIEGTIGENGEAVVYSTELVDGSQVELSEGTVGGGRITMYDREGNVLDLIPAGTEFTGREYTLRGTANYTGTYYLKVEGEAGNEYEIDGSTTEPDDNEPDDSPSDATETSVGDLNQGTAIKGDSDFYAVDLNEGQRFAVAANGTAVASVRVHDTDGTVVATEEVFYPGGFEEGELGERRIIDATTANAGGTYYFEVFVPENNIGDVNGDYNLTVVGVNDDEASTDEPMTDDGADADGITNDDARSGEDGETDPETSTAADGTDADGSSTENGTADEETTESETSDDDDAESGGTDTAETTLAGTGDDERTTGTTGTTETADTATTEPASESSDANTQITAGNSDVAEDVEETAVNGPGFGIVAALIALLGAVLFATRRR